MSTNLAPLPGNLPAAPGLVGGTSFAGASGGPRVSPLFRYLATLRRFKWLVLLLAVVGLGGGALAARYLRESYNVQAMILIADQSNGFGQSNPLFVAQQWRENFLSYKIIQPVAEARQLYIIGPKSVGAPPPSPGPSGPDKALFNAFAIDQERYLPGSYQLQINKDGRTWELQHDRTRVKESGAVGDSIGRRFGFRWLPTIERRWYGASFSFDMITPREAADQVRENLNVTVPPRAARFMTLKYTATDPREAAATLNSLMKRFVAEAGVQKRKNLTLEAATLDSQMTQATAALRAAETALQQYKIRTITKPRDNLPVAPGLAQTSPQGFATYISQREQVTELRREREDLAGAMKKAKSGQPIIDDLRAIPAVNASPDLLRDRRAAIGSGEAPRPAEGVSRHLPGEPETDRPNCPVARHDIAEVLGGRASAPRHRNRANRLQHHRRRQGARGHPGADHHRRSPDPREGSRGQGGRHGPEPADPEQARRCQHHLGGRDL